MSGAEKIASAAAHGTTDDLLRSLALYPGHIDQTSGYEGRVPMHYAAEFGRADNIEALVKSGSQALDYADREGTTPMHLAAATKSPTKSDGVSALEALVRLGSRAIDTHRHYDGWTPMHMAAATHPSIVEALIRLGSQSIDARNKNGRTPMHIAAEKDRPQCIELLVRLGSQALDLPQERNRYTPMHWAAFWANPRCIEALARLGSRAIDMPSFSGLTPLGLAAQSERFSTACETPSETVELLKMLGARHPVVPVD